MGAPGKSFVRMFDLLFHHNSYAWRQFSDRLLIGIFWEETLFNNVYQTGPNTGVGFGQTEPAEFKRFKEYGLTPPPTYTWTNGGVKYTAAQRPLTDVEAVQAASILLASLYDSLGSIDATLKTYAGYWWALKHPSSKGPSANERLSIIKRWQACERQLKDVKPYKRPTREEQDVIMNALAMARPFYRDPFRDALFPWGDYS